MGKQTLQNVRTPAAPAPDEGPKPTQAEIDAWFAEHYGPGSENG